jgi:hypothetical protein
LIPLFNIILVTGIVNWLPKSKLIVMVMDIAMLPTLYNVDPHILDFSIPGSSNALEIFPRHPITSGMVFWIAVVTIRLPPAAPMIKNSLQSEWVMTVAAYFIQC